MKCNKVKKKKGKKDKRKKAKRRTKAYLNLDHSFSRIRTTYSLESKKVGSTAMALDFVEEIDREERTLE